MRLRFLLGTVSLSLMALAVASCSDFKKGADSPVDAGGTLADGGVLSEGGVDPVADAGEDGKPIAPRADEECNEPWAKADKTSAACKDRKVVLVDNKVTETTSLSIARTDDGRVAISYNGLADVGSVKSQLLLALFSSKGPNVAPVVKEPFPSSSNEEVGIVHKLVPGPGNSMHLAYTVDSQLRYASLPSGKDAFTAPENITTGMSAKSQVMLGARDDGVVHFVYVKTGAPGSISHVYRKADKSLSPAVTIEKDLSGTNTPGLGNGQMFIEPDGTPNFLYQWGASVGSAPRHHSWNGQEWTYRHTIDNNTFNGLCGFSAQLSVFKQEKRAAYFYRKGDQTGPSTADLIVARWTVPYDPDKITKEILEQDMPAGEIPNATLRFRFRVAMAQDPAGLLHLAIVRPSTLTSAMLEYKRQVLDQGHTTWLTDIIDTNVVGTEEDAFVDITVDSNFRPHIGYRSGLDLNVYYASRFDR